MTAFVALLRGINVGGATTLAMAELRRIAAEAGLANVRTHIASGNLLFESDLGEPALKRMIEERLEALTGRRIPVCLRSAAEMAAVAAANPFADRPGNRTVAIFLDAPPPADAAETAKGAAGERIAPGVREIYVFYPDGQGRSKLQIPAAREGTARNMNTVAKLTAMLRG